MPCKTYKKYIRKFDFENPNWSCVPKGFPNLNKKGLNKEEGHLLDAIALAWLTTGPGKTTLYKKAIKSGTLLIISFISLIELISFINSPGQGRLLKSASAATISTTLKRNVNEVIESTMSAVFR